MEKKKALFLSLLVVFIGVAIAGGTFAWFTANVSVTNESYVGATDCFLIDYNINNDDNTQNITGTLFPASGPLRPGTLGGKVSLKINNACTISGVGTLKLQINNTTNSVFGTTVAAHCENPTTLETLNDHKTQSDCTSNDGTWITNGTALKYAVYETDTTGDPVSVGYVTSSMIGTNTPIHTGFGITKTARVFYIYLWLDGYNSNDNAEAYYDVPFSGNINASATQTTGNLPPEYQQVEYIQSNGSQYINTGLTPTNTMATDIVYVDTTASSSNYVLGSRNASSGTINYAISGAASGLKISASFNGTAYTYSITRNRNNKYHIYIKPEYTSGSGYRIYGKLENLTTGATDEGYGSYINSGVASNSATINIFALHSSNKHAGYQLYSLKFWNGDTLIRDYVPCFNKDTNVIGLYDIVNGEFYPPTAGTFTKGANVNY